MVNSAKAIAVCLLITGLLASGLGGCVSVEEAAEKVKEAA